MTLEILKNSRVAPLEVFFTYFPFGMQDHFDRLGETNMAENIVKELIDYYKVSRIYTIDVHFWGREWTQKYPITNVSAVEILKQKAIEEHSNLVYLAPDMGAQIRTGLAGTKKERKNSHNVRIKCSEEFKKAVFNKTVAAVDDLLETGGTMELFYDECLKHGAKGAVALITHGVLKIGIERIKNKYQNFYLTNTINQENANVDVSDLIYTQITSNK